MMKFILLLIFSTFFISAFAQKEIKLEDVDNHIGDSVKLKAKIHSGRYVTTEEGSPTFLNVGGNYPNAPLILVIWDKSRNLFHEAPERIYPGQMVWISGKLFLYKGKPEIIISNPNQLIEVAGVPLEKLQ